LGDVIVIRGGRSVTHLRIGLLVTMGLLCSASASAGLFEDIYRGLEIFTTPVGGPSGSRRGQLVITPNELGRGYRLELDRTFGSDSSGRPETYDLGNFELTVFGSVQSTLEFTRRGILTGNAQIRTNNLSYSLSGKSGAQDFELLGRLNVSQDLEINKLGFYTLQLEINNTASELIIEGLVAEGSPDTDFDIGPIDIKGNVDTSELEGIFPKSPIDVINDEIEKALRGQALVLGEDHAIDIDSGALSSAAALEAKNFVADLILEIDDAEDYGLTADGDRVPEPTGFLVLALLGLIVARRQG
jgi:hypothetical protein